MTFDFKNPDYRKVFYERTLRLQKLRADPHLLAACKVWYAAHPDDFVNDWGLTVDFRVKGRSAVMPFLLFPKQRDLMQWFMQRWTSGDDGIVEKSRDVGASWLAMALACTLSLFNKSLSFGFGSQKESKVDNGGDPDSLFYKGRMFMQNLPAEFRGNWDVRRHAPFMKILFPETGSSITGEVGDNIGRGGRKTMYFIDESAHLEHPALVDASMASVTNCRIDISSVRGLSSPFAQKRHSGTMPVFTFHWRHDPRKDDAWYAELPKKHDPIVIAQEFDINYSASMEGIVIPSIWVQAAVNAHIKLKIKASGALRGSLDVADEGMDKNAFAIRHGNVITHAESWTGKESDIYATTEKAFTLCDHNNLTGFSYDADGLGAGVRGDARKVNEKRKADGFKELHITPFRGSDAVLDPERIVPMTDRKAGDMFENRKAQAWWALRFRFQATYRAVQGESFNPDDIVSISNEFPEYIALCNELSQPQYGLSKAGKILIQKKPDGSKSPNLGDCVMQLLSPSRPPMVINPALLEPGYAASTRAPLATRQHA